MPVTAYSQSYQQVKDATQRQTQQVFANGAATPVDEWTPEYIASYADNVGRIVEAGQMIVGNLTSVDQAAKLGTKPSVVDPLITMRDNGIAKVDEYQRPFWEVVKADRDGKPDPLEVGQRRLEMLSATDLEMAKVRQAQIALKAAGRKTYRRVVTSDNPCELCEIASTQIYYTEDLMPIHTNCSCDVEADDTEQDEMDSGFDGIHGDGSDRSKDVTALNESDAPAEDYRKLVAVRGHGEVGPMLTWAAQKFLGPQNLPNFTAGERSMQASRERQLELQRKQLARAVEHNGTADFRRVTTTAERNKVLEQAKSRLQWAKDNAPAHLAEVNQRAEQRVTETAEDIERRRIAEPTESETQRRDVDYYWTSNFDDHKEVMREGAEEAHRSGYEGLPKLKAWDRDKFYESTEGRKAIGAEMYSRILHSDTPTTSPVFRGVTFHAGDLAKYQVGDSVSLPLSSFGFHDAALSYMRGEYGFVSVDREGRDIPVLIRLERGARVTELKEPNMLTESITTGQFEVVSVKDNPNRYKEITLRQTSVIPKNSSIMSEV